MLSLGKFATGRRELGERVEGLGGRVRVVRATGTGGLHDDCFLFKNIFFRKYQPEKFAKIKSDQELMSLRLLVK